MDSKTDLFLCAHSDMAVAYFAGQYWHWCGLSSVCLALMWLERVTELTKPPWPQVSHL